MTSPYTVATNASRPIHPTAAALQADWVKPKVDEFEACSWFATEHFQMCCCCETLLSQVGVSESPYGFGESEYVGGGERHVLPVCWECVEGNALGHTIDDPRKEAYLRAKAREARSKAYRALLRIEGIYESILCANNTLGRRPAQRIASFL